MDCLFWFMIYFDYVVFNDLDEFIVLFYYDNISVLLKEIYCKEYCGYCF